MIKIVFSLNFTFVTVPKVIRIHICRNMKTDLSTVEPR